MTRRREGFGIQLLFFRPAGPTRSGPVIENTGKNIDSDSFFVFFL